ncbi:Phosphoribosylglycinamide formyltransferase, chloroplastic [Glycine max]|nr:Phosphoribosylglycinamide formyltransferase, chloroplastic [Glycine max]KAH1194408.1 Phosphoribosylglycinamide formyltransferase, chloroplastic [Glycine max]
MSMEAQQILSRFCPKPSSVPSIPIVKQQFSPKFPRLPSSSLYPSSQSQNLNVPSGAFHPISIVHKEVCSSSCKRIWCSSSSSSSTAEPKEGHEVRAQVTVRRKKLAVFVSGGGSNFRAIHEASKRGSLHGDVLVLVTNKSDCGGAEYARNNGIPVILYHISKDESNPSDLVDTLRKFEVDFILLAGYLKLIPVELIRAYKRSIFNIHPSLLPAFGGKGFYGMKVHKAVIASGARFSGPTIHFVDEHYDTGRILAQRVVPVLANDTVEELAARVLKEEHQLYVEVVEALCEERVVWRQDGVPLIQSKENPNEFR